MGHHLLGMVRSAQRSGSIPAPQAATMVTAPITTERAATIYSRCLAALFIRVSLVPSMMRSNNASRAYFSTGYSLEMP